MIELNAGSRDGRTRFVELTSALLVCILLDGCGVTGWHEVQPRYDAAHAPSHYEFRELNPKLTRIWGAADGSQMWAVGEHGTILHYTAQTGRWETQSSGTTEELVSIFGSTDALQAWAVGDKGSILHYTATTGRWDPQEGGDPKPFPIPETKDETQRGFVSSSTERAIFRSSDGTQLWAVGSGIGIVLHYNAQAGRWETQNTGTNEFLWDIFGSNDGAQLWAVGFNGPILHYTAQTRRWEPQESDPGIDEKSIFGSSDGSQLWAVGSRAGLNGNQNILHYTAQTGRWETQSSGVDSDLTSVFGSSDGSQMWAVGERGIITHYTAQKGHWEQQSSGTTEDLTSVGGSTDGSQMWAVGNRGTILHYIAQTGSWEPQGDGTPRDVKSVFGSSDWSQIWAVEKSGTIRHYAAQTGQWEPQSTGTSKPVSPIFESTDGAQLWALAEPGTILHYTVQAGHWEAQSSGTSEKLASIFGTNGGKQAWAVGEKGTITQYSAQTGRWEPQSSGTSEKLVSIFGTSDGTQARAVGEEGTVLNYTAETGRWEAHRSGTKLMLDAVSGTSDGSQLWGLGERQLGSEGHKYDTILHYSLNEARWEAQSESLPVEGISLSGNGAQLWAYGSEGTLLHFVARTGRWESQTTNTTAEVGPVFVSRDGGQVWVAAKSDLLQYSMQTGLLEPHGTLVKGGFRDIAASGDGSQLWAVEDTGEILRGVRTRDEPYISEVKLAPGPLGADLQVRVIEPHGYDPAKQVQLTLSGSRKRSFEIDHNVHPISAKSQPPQGPGEPWTFHFNPKELDVQAGTDIHLQIALRSEGHEASYEVDLPYDPYRFFADHWVATAIVAFVTTLITILILLLIARPLWIVYLYRKLKLYNLVEQIDIPGVGKLLQFLLKFTLLPWFVNHPRTLRAWAKANRSKAAAAWAAAFETPVAVLGQTVEQHVPYVALPVQLRDVSVRTLSQPTAKDFEILFQGPRNVVQIVGPGGCGKTTLARRIGDLALAGGEPGGFEHCRLPIWVDEDFTDLFDVVKRKVNSWYNTGEDIEGTLVRALLENGLLVVMIDRVSERLPGTQAYLAKVHGSVRCNALLLTTRQPIVVEIP
jgi:photosystem II stability/assembly factor-like uncharacterized protein